MEELIATMDAISARPGHSAEVAVIDKVPPPPPLPLLPPCAHMWGPHLNGLGKGRWWGTSGGETKFALPPAPPGQHTHTAPLATLAALTSLTSLSPLHLS